jgi:hypothetical protein
MTLPPPPYLPPPPVLYEPSLIKKPKRFRRTNDQIGELRNAIWHIVSQAQPMSVRGAFYQASVRGRVNKTDHGPNNGYTPVQRAILQMRREGVMPYSWIVDNTRWQLKKRSPKSWLHSMKELPSQYNRDLWCDTGLHVEIWVEKDALASVIKPVTDRYDVGLFVARGYSSESFLEDIARQMKQFGRTNYIYHLGDHDPSGVNAAETIHEGLKRLAGPGTDITFERLAVLPWQIQQWSLPTRPTKMTDTRAKKFVAKYGPDSCELDAIHPNQLRNIVTEAIQRHMSEEQFNELKGIEEDEREYLQKVVRFVEQENTHP